MGLAKGTLSNVNRPHHDLIVEDIAKSEPLLSNNTLGGWVSSCVGRSPTTSTRLEDDRSACHVTYGLLTMVCDPFALYM
jgi:hypothetical protein